MDFDYVIIGAGAAGCVLANRLSASGTSRILLIEAGPDFAGGSAPASVSDIRGRSNYNPSYMWQNLRATFSPGPGSASADAERLYLHGRVMGGGSSVNGMNAQRGFAADYDEMEEMGAKGWSASDVLPYFKKLETDRDFPDSELHGSTGPFPIRRFGSSDMSGFERGLQNVWAKRGYGHVADVSGAPADGVGYMPLNIDEQGRGSVARTYLPAEVRNRDGLTIMADCAVVELVVKKDEVTGVVVEGPAGRQTISAARTILCAGAIGSPLLLMRSGIGEGEALRAAGVAVKYDLPGVGRNLQNHPTLVLATHLPRKARSAAHLPRILLGLTYSSGVPDCDPSDMQVIIFNKTPGPTSWNPVGRRVAFMMGYINKPYGRGSVTLNPKDPTTPLIKFNFLEDPRDRDRLEGLFANLSSYMADPLMDGLRDNVFFPGKGGFSKDNLVSTLGSSIAAGLMDASRLVRDRVLASVGQPLASVQDDEDKLSRLILPAAHASCTCRMGDPADRGTVVDPRCNVVGIRNLRVVDASIFPSLMRAGPHLPTIMAAEKAADMIVEDDRLRR